MLCCATGHSPWRIQSKGCAHGQKSHYRRISRQGEDHQKFLGPGYLVQASVGHIRDLPKSNIGVDEANDFAPEYEIIQGKEKVVQSLRDA